MINQPKLNLACGQIRIDGYFGIDLVKTENVDAQMNLQDFPWDIASDSAEEVICNHYVEHTPMETHADRLIRAIMACPDFEYLKKVVPFILLGPNDGLIDFMTELYRILKMGGTAKIETPYYNGDIAWRDPTHRRAITEVTFRYFNQQWLKNSGLDHYGINSNFDFKLNGYDIYSDLNYSSPKESAFAQRHLGNVIRNMHVTLTKIPLLT